jgi:UDP-3-O-[3-hydroxymyristoyl] glucosamine N-acyltransferase
MSKVNAQDIAVFLNEKLIGENILIKQVSAIDKIMPNSISFISKYHCKDDISKNALVLTSSNFKVDGSSKNSYIKVANPKLEFARVVEKFFHEKKDYSISKSASISSDVKLGNNIYIGENVVIENGCSIGDNTTIEHNVVILKNCHIGSECKINPGVVIGDDGLGSLKDENKNLIMLRHLGKVVIEDFVEIGANSTIARGSINDTIIKKYTKIGPQVNIGHNTFIDENCEVAGRAHTSGSVRIGKHCFIGANCSIKENINIGNNCIVGIAAVVTNNIGDNITVMGLEAIKLKGLVKFKKETSYK